MKERWRTPSIQVEEFEANEYVAACWQIACAVPNGAAIGEQVEDPMPGSGGPWWDRWTTGTHSRQSNGTGCGWEHSQYIVEVRDGVFNVTEYGDNILPCELTRNPNWSGLSSTISNVQVGETIYWTTELGNTVWHHYGTVGQADPNHPNRS